METTETFKRVYIKTESDLPKENGKYLVSSHFGNSDREPYYRTFEINRPAFKKFWLNYVDWYLSPINEAQGKEEEVFAVIADALYATGGLTTDQCDNITDGIIRYLHDEGYEITKVDQPKEQPSRNKETEYCKCTNEDVSLLEAITVCRHCLKPIEQYQPDEFIESKSEKSNEILQEYAREGVPMISDEEIRKHVIETGYNTFNLEAWEGEIKYEIEVIKKWLNRKTK